MTFQDFLVIYGITFVIFGIIDAIWLGGIAKDLYRHALRNRISNPPFWPAAAMFYLIFITGLLYFAILPAINDDSLLSAAVNGSLYGFFTYATYGLTNLATLKKWPQLLVFIDIGWGTAACLTASTLAYTIFTAI
jgi:uncharacterized membrane protein